MKIEFVSYTGKPPCLCMGVLTLKIDGKISVFSNLMKTGGYCRQNGEEKMTAQGKWQLKDENLPLELLPYKRMILRVINKNVPQGCCGGCL